MAFQPLVESVVERRIEQVKDEIATAYPDARVEWKSGQDGRAIITVSLDGHILSQEFVETEESLSKPTRMSEYFRVLTSKRRLVVIVPKCMALKIRLKMLDFNQMWLFYYMVFYYDDAGSLTYIDRRTMRRLAGHITDPLYHPEVA